MRNGSVFLYTKLKHISAGGDDTDGLGVNWWALLNKNTLICSIFKELDIWRHKIPKIRSNAGELVA
jgi:hypothetical protein